ncbi:MAG: 2-deoxyribose-5-phosphate aldolase [Nitrososphaerota archaeon]
MSSWEQLAGRCDLAFLRPEASEREFLEVLELVAALRPYGLVVPSSLAREARLRLGQVKLIGAVGFPFGYATLESKIAELDYLLAQGVDEVDFVPNPYYLRWGRLSDFYRELAAFRERAPGIVLKAIVEVGVGEPELKAVLRGLTEYGIDFLKLGTGFGPRPVSADDVRLAKRLAPVKVKAAGGIRGLAQALALLEAGADRLGLSRLDLLRTEWEAAQGRPKG